MGMPRLRQAYTPHPVVDQSAAHLRAYIDGSDAISGRPFMQEVLDGLTAPLEDADLHGLSFERTTPRFVEPDTEDNLQRLFEENRWTDMLPIVLPTEARVEAMLRATKRRGRWVRRSLLSPCRYTSGAFYPPLLPTRAAHRSSGASTRSTSPCPRVLRAAVPRACKCARAAG